MKMRIEIGDAVDVIERDADPLRQRLQLVRRQVPILVLDGSQVVEDQEPP